MSAEKPLSQTTQPDNPYSALISQQICVIPSFTLESGVTLTDVPVAYKTWGKLNERADNCLVICHALTGSADVEDWWGPLLGVDKAFDPTRFFIFCGNVIGSPYGTISSVTTNPETGKPYGPEIPGSSVKDDVRLQYIILKSLGVKAVAAAIGGSMGGATVLEYPLNTPPGFVRSIIPLATSARHSAWGISWGEAQRQSIYSDPDYKDGYYYESDDGSLNLTMQPTRGLAAARMAALLTYRSRDSFEARFGRRAQGAARSKVPKGGVRIMGGQETTDPSVPSESDLASTGKSPSWRAWREHNDGNRSASGRGVSRKGSVGSEGDADKAEVTKTEETKGSEQKVGTGGDSVQPKVFSAQSYLRYQGDKFTGRFDANCYIHITRKLDTHDLSTPSRDASLSSVSSSLPALSPTSDATEEELDARLTHALSLEPPALVIGIESDGLFTTSEQKELAAHIPDAELVIIPSPDGHDGFLLEFEAINGWAEGWMKRKMPEYYNERVIPVAEYASADAGFGVKKESVFGEAEVDADITSW